MTYSNNTRIFLLSFFTTITFTVFLSTTYAATTTDEFLKFHWAFNEATGTIANDTSGNEITYPGTLYNGPTWIPEGGLTFDGIDDFVRTDEAIQNSMGISDQGYTLSASVRVHESGENGNIIHISSGAGGTGWCIAMLHMESGKFRAIGWNSGAVVATDPTEANPDEWYSIANTWSPDTQEMDLYVNGALVASSSMDHFTAADQDVYVFAGIDPGGCDNNHSWFRGDIKDVRIYSRAITQTEAVQNSNESISTTTPAIEIPRRRRIIINVPELSIDLPIIFEQKKPIDEIPKKPEVPIIKKDTPLQECKAYINSYIKLGSKNDSRDVSKLQTFLNAHDGESLTVDGIYKKTDAEAVKRFQSKHSDVLTFWNIDMPTGYVYLATQKAINSIYCEDTQKITCPYFKTFAKLGDENPDVTKIKIFLNETQSAGLDVSSTLFDTQLRDAIKKFQTKYANKTLDPWGFKTPTGWWYQSTMKTANDILGCFAPVKLDNGKVLE